MPKNTTVGIFLAATAALATTAVIPEHSMAGDKHGDMGGNKESTTAQEAEEENKKDKNKTEEEQHPAPRVPSWLCCT